MDHTIFMYKQYFCHIVKLQHLQQRLFQYCYQLTKAKTAKGHQSNNVKKLSVNFTHIRRGTHAQWQTRTQMHVLCTYECECVLKLKICLMYTYINTFAHIKISISRYKGAQSATEFPFRALIAFLPTNCLGLYELSCHLDSIALVVLISA